MLMHSSESLQHYPPKEVTHDSRRVRTSSCPQFSPYRLTFGVTANSEDDVVMPEEPPPGLKEQRVDSDYNIQMPESPPPVKIRVVRPPPSRAGTSSSPIWASSSPSTVYSESPTSMSPPPPGLFSGNGLDRVRVPFQVYHIGRCRGTRRYH
jgi:hypothetical protein